MKNTSIMILGPTASGKTKLAVALAESLGGEIISADSRQVYRGMDIGTGKDLKEYKSIRHHLIDHLEAGEKYNVQEFIADAEAKIEDIQSRGAVPIICGGTGMYLQGLVQGMPFNQIPKNPDLRSALEKLSLVSLQEMIQDTVIPKEFKVDQSTHKRCVRALEIADWWQKADRSEKQIILEKQPLSGQNLIIFGISIPQDIRRKRITERLKQRIDEGMIQEVQNLLIQGISHEQLEYYGLEYKYCSLLIRDLISESAFFERLNTEIHRFAKRQMTYFRKMEKDGIKINWLDFQENGLESYLKAIQFIIDRNTVTKL